MLIFRTIYRAFEKIIREVQQSCNHFRTYLKFKAYCDTFYDFTSCGVPYVYVSRAKGGSIKIGKGFVVNNGMHNNVIGFGHTPCALSATGLPSPTGFTGCKLALG